MKLEVKQNCPMNKFEPCKQFECAWFIQVRGQNPQTGQEVDEYACAVAWMPLLMIDNSQQQRQTGAAVESFRNEMVRSNIDTQRLLAQSQHDKRILNYDPINNHTK